MFCPQNVKYCRCGMTSDGVDCPANDKLFPKEILKMPTDLDTLDYFVTTFEFLEQY